MKVNNDLVEKIRAARRKLATDGPIRVRSAGDFERVSIGMSDGDVLRDLVLAEKAHTVIEIGLAYGSSALAIAEAWFPRGRANVATSLSTPTRIGSTTPDGVPSSKQASLTCVCCFRSALRSFYPVF
jgi:hypothetical protein